MYIYTLGFLKYYILLILLLIVFIIWDILKWYDKLTLSYLIRRVAGVLKGMLVLKLKAKCGLSNDKEKRKLGGKITSISEHVSFQGSNWEERYFACVNKEKLITDIDTDKLALISDCPFLMCVFYVPSNKMISAWLT